MVAWVPDDAVERMAEISFGAFALYTYYCKRRRKDNGRCWPSVAETAKDLSLNPDCVGRWRKELQKQGWIRLQGSVVTLIVGFLDSNEIRQKVGLSDEVSSNGIRRIVGNPLMESDKKSDEVLIKSDNSSVESDKKSDSLSMNQPNNHVLNTGKGEAPAPTPVNIRHPAIQACKRLTGYFPDKILYARICQVLGDAFDEDRLRSCREEWVGRGYNARDYAWVLEWYALGIPERKNGNGRPAQVAQRHGEHAGKNTEFAFRPSRTI